MLTYSPSELLLRSCRIAPLPHLVTFSVFLHMSDMQQIIKLLHLLSEPTLHWTDHAFGMSAHRIDSTTNSCNVISLISHASL